MNEEWSQIDREMKQAVAAQLLNEGNIRPDGLLHQMLDAAASPQQYEQLRRQDAMLYGIGFDPAVPGADQTWEFLRIPSLDERDRSADFMSDWMAFQDAEREDRAKLQWGSAWPPKVGLEFPR
jgi:hypothetical protein